MDGRSETGGISVVELTCGLGVDELDSDVVMRSPGIAERIDPLSRLVRFAVKSDFSRDYASNLGLLEYVNSVEEQLPRLAVEKVLADAVVNQAAKLPVRVDSMTWPSTEKHPSSSWPGILLRAHIENPGYEGVNPAF